MEAERQILGRQRSPIRAKAEEPSPHRADTHLVAGTWSTMPLSSTEPLDSKGVEPAPTGKSPPRPPQSLNPRSTLNLAAERSGKAIGELRKA